MPITKTNVKKDGLQQYRVRVNYTDIAGSHRQIERTAYGLAEAKQLEIQLAAEYKRGTAPSPSKMTLSELFAEYETYHKAETRATSHDSAMRRLRDFVLPQLGDIRINRLTQPMLAGWRSDLAGKDYSLTTKRNAYAAFSAMLNYAVKMGYLATNPLSVLGNFRGAESVEDFASFADKLHYYTAEQFLQYITAARDAAKTVYDWGFVTFFYIAFYTGARKGEINALKWSDIDDNILHIRRSIAQKLRGDDVETPPKNKSSYRDLQIPAPLMDILAEHKARQQAASRLFSESYRICGGERPLRDTSIDKHNRAYATAADLPHIRVHDFRHTHATLLANEGINIQEIARRLGHSNVQQTWQTYSHLYPREEERAVKILNNIR